MDLANFESTDLTVPTPSNIARSTTTAEDVLKYIDSSKWYTSFGRRGRWMDLMGDYAGTEPFIIEGESLLENVLSDPLLRIAHVEDLSFQMLHAFYILEKLLNDFLSRQANFDVVFWRVYRINDASQENRDGALQFAAASRALARALLFLHLQKLGVPVHIFDDLSDPRFRDYKQRRRPMFVMVNHTGPISSTAASAIPTLIRRMMVFDLLCQNIAVCSLAGTEFRETKILTFVYEQRQDHRLLSDKDVLSARSFITNPSRPAAEVSQSTIPFQFLQELARQVLTTMPTFPTEILYIFLLHSILLEEIPVDARALPFDNIDDSPLLRNILVPCLRQIFSSGASILDSPSHANVPVDIEFNVDGRLFVKLLRFLATNSELDTLPNLVGARAFIRTQEIWLSLGSPHVDIARLVLQLPQSESLSQAVIRSTVPRYAVLNFCFRDPSLNDILSIDGLQTVACPSNVADDHFGEVLFTDDRHWHSSRSILPSHLGGKSEPLDDFQRRKKLRSEQRFMARMQSHAATLTGALGSSLTRIVITPKGSNTTALVRTAGNVKTHGKTIKENSKVKLSSADKLRLKIQEEKAAKSLDSGHSWWQSQLDILKKLPNSQQVSHLIKLNRNNKRTNDPYMGTEIRLYDLHLHLGLWIEEKDPASQAVHDRYSVGVMHRVKTILGSAVLTVDILKAIESVLGALGLYQLREDVQTRTTKPSDTRLSFKFVKLLKSKSETPLYDFMRVREPFVVWQLRLFGEFMDRSMDSAPDSRVSFEPDEWQRKVLDAIDRNSSLLVVAPTSAGKTFISYYAMEIVLRQSDTDILVYVAPTKALVNQIAAEVYARFSKNLTSGSFWAIHTRDYRVHNSQKCQILVTVPEILAVMLLSPSLAKNWTSRIKWIILDEIHSIGQQEGGAVWEQIILFAPCPIIGLSATVGEPHIFNQWLESVQRVKGYDHTFIEHPHRYSHLRKHWYDLRQPPVRKAFDLSTYKSSERLRVLHPVAALVFGGQSIPQDLALEAGDTLSLYQALRDHTNEVTDELEPTKFFSSVSGFLRQKDVLRYEAALKARLNRLLESSDYYDPTSAIHRVVASLQDPQTPADMESMNMDAKRFLQNLPFMVADLHANGDLPAILFNFDRTECELMAEHLLSILEQAEQRWKANSDEWKSKMEEWTKWKQRSKERERLVERAAKQKKDKDDSGSADVDTSWQHSFDPDTSLEQFSFADMRAYSRVALEEDIRELSWTSTPKWAIDALRRGIAVHHSGMNKAYRSLVESLFRRKFVRVVIATGTLALGINAPARTCVFCGDSPFLTALLYRQCAGRAGRRGFDLRGNVVFYGISMDRVHRLMLSKIPTLQASFPMSSTLTLRLINLLEGSDYDPVAVRCFQNITSLPRISFGSDVGKHQLLHHLRFSIEYLQRARLLRDDGQPMNLFGIAAHLYYTQPSNFALVALLRSGVMHKVCSATRPFEDAKHDFIEIMAHLFGRKYLSATYASPENLSAIRSKYPSRVILPPLAPEIQDVLREHEKETLQVFKAYVLAFTAAHGEELGVDCHLPISGDATPRYVGQEETPFLQHLRSIAIPVKARSMFVANSGHSDTFDSVAELARTVRSGIYLNGDAVPSFNHLIAGHGQREREHASNAYLLDFYTHGQAETIVTANAIRRGDLWYLLEDFSLTLKTVQTSLYELLVCAAGDTPIDVNSEQVTEDGLSDEEEGKVVTGLQKPKTEDGLSDDEGKVATDLPQKPKGLREEDWRVYTVVHAAYEEFALKFKAMWA